MSVLSVFSFEIQADPVAVFSVLRGDRYSIFLDSADRAHRDSRYSYIAFHPFETIEVKDSLITVTDRNGQVFTDHGDPFLFLRERLRFHDGATARDPDLPPFQGGAAGYFGYDMARVLEALPEKAAASATIPDMAIGLYDRVIAFDHHRHKAWFITQASDEKTARERRAQIDGYISLHAPSPFPQAPLLWQPAFSRRRYEQTVRKVIDYIHAGDIFQANLSQHFKANVPDGFDPFAHYCRLRAVNPAPFAAYMNLDTVRISSASPERFLSVHERHVETRPIKGTRARLPDPAQDADIQEDLRSSIKDRAENVMIVDLLRNDLSKVCEDLSVEVPALCALESFAGVHHLVSTVTGTLRQECDAIDLLRACFPGGSITGAPKVRAMEIIEELEPLRRGPYCGAIGYVGFDGAMDTNIAIRTLVYDGQSVSFNAGGGIVADSDPAAEYEETLVKAQRIFDSFETDTERERAAS